MFGRFGLWFDLVCGLILIVVFAVVFEVCLWFIDYCVCMVSDWFDVWYCSLRAFLIVLL